MRVLASWKVSPLLGLLIKSFVSMNGVREGGEIQENSPYCNEGAQ